MSNVYILMESVDYEGSTPVMAFDDKAIADKWLQSVIDWKALQPQWYGDDEESYELYDKENESWVKSAPSIIIGKVCVVSDSFYIHDLGLTIEPPKEAE